MVVLISAASALYLLARGFSVSEESTCVSRYFDWGEDAGDALSGIRKAGGDKDGPTAGGKGGFALRCDSMSVRDWRIRFTSAVGSIEARLKITTHCCDDEMVSAGEEELYHMWACVHMFFSAAQSRICLLALVAVRRGSYAADQPRIARHARIAIFRVDVISRGHTSENTRRARSVPVRSEENEETASEGRAAFWQRSTDLSHLSLLFLHGSQLIALRARLGAGWRLSSPAVGSASVSLAVSPLGERVRLCFLLEPGLVRDVEPGDGPSASMVPVPFP